MIDYANLAKVQALQHLSTYRPLTEGEARLLKDAVDHIVSEEEPCRLGTSVANTAVTK